MVAVVSDLSQGWDWVVTVVNEHFGLATLCILTTFHVRG